MFLAWQLKFSFDGLRQRSHGLCVGDHVAAASLGAVPEEDDLDCQVVPVDTCVNTGSELSRAENDETKQRKRNADQ